MYRAPKGQAYCYSIIDTVAGVLYNACMGETKRVEQNRCAIPHKPNSRLQKYRLTEKGHIL